MGTSESKMGTLLYTSKGYKRGNYKKTASEV